MIAGIVSRLKVFEAVAHTYQNDDRAPGHEASRARGYRKLAGRSAPADAIDRATAISRNAGDANPIPRGNDDGRDNDRRGHDNPGNRRDGTDNAALRHPDRLAIDGRVGRSRACRQEEKRREAGKCHRDARKANIHWIVSYQVARLKTAKAAAVSKGRYRPKTVGLLWAGDSVARVKGQVADGDPRGLVQIVVIKTTT